MRTPPNQSLQRTSRTVTPRAYACVLLLTVANMLRSANQSPLAWETEVQKRYEAAVMSADRITIESVFYGDRKRVRRTRMVDSRSLDDIRAWATCIQFRFPPEQKPEASSRLTFPGRIDDLGYFSVVFLKEQKLVLTLEIHDNLVRCPEQLDAHLAGILIPIDDQAFGPQLKRLRDDFKNRAIQSVAPTSGTVTPRADARVAPVPPVAHL